MTRTIVITGASSGIGANTAERLAEQGWDVAVVGRNPERTRRVAAEVGGSAFVADFDRLDEVRELAAALDERYASIDVLANNAGGLVSKRGISADGHERTLQHNHLAPFLLTTLLLPKLETSRARVIGTASVANAFGSLRLDDLEWRRRAWAGGWRAYGTSKIATIVFGRELARRTSLESYTFHPGLVSTSFGADSTMMKIGSALSGGRYGISAEQGATPLVHLATVEEVAAPNGSYFDGLKLSDRVHKSAAESNIGERLWSATEELLAR